MKKNQIKFGYSDIRLWFSYLITLTLVFIAGLWFTLFWATVFFAAPIFLLSIKMLGVLDHDAKVHKKWQMPVERAVFEAIYLEEIRQEKENELLRKNTKIIQEQEKELKQSKRKGLKGHVKTA